MKKMCLCLPYKCALCLELHPSNAVLLTRELFGAKQAGGFSSMISLHLIDKSVVLFPSSTWTVQSIQETQATIYIS